MAACRAAAAGAQAFDAPPVAPIDSLAFPGQCLGSVGSSLFPGGQDIGLVPCAAAPAFRFDAASRTLRMATAAGGELCLDVLGSNASAGARVLAYECKGDGSLNQQWALAPLGGGGPNAVALQSALATPHLCLDLEAAPPPPPPAAPYVALSMRIGVYERNGPPPSGYTLKVQLSPNATAGAAWSLNFARTVLAAGVTPAPVLPGVFYTARVAAQGATVTASWAGAQLAQVVDDKKLSGYGMAAVGSGWHEAWFDNVKFEAV